MVSNSSKAVMLFLAIIIALSAIVIASLAWHSLPPKEELFQLSVENYDTEVTTANACFTLGFEAENFEEKELTLVLKLNDEIINSFEINSAGKKERKLCIENSLLKDGKNIIEANIHSRKVFFHVDKKASIVEKQALLEVSSFEKKSDFKGVLHFSVQNPTGKRERVKILLNGKQIKGSFYSDGKHEETIPIVEGKNSIEISFQGIQKNASLQNTTGIKSNIYIGLVVISLVLFVFIVFVFGKKSLVENIAYSICSFFIIIILLFFFLAYSGVLSNVSFIIALVIAAISLIFLFRKNFSIPKLSNNSINIFGFFLGLMVFFVLLFNIITPTNVSFWTSFYEHQSKTIFEKQALPSLDEYFNFGEKPYGYLSGYFFTSAGIGFLTGEHSEKVFALIVFLASLAMILCALTFFKKAGLSREKSLLTVMLMLLGGFLFADFFFTPRHIIALALAFFSLSLFVEKKRVLAGSIAGIAMLVQAPIIIIIGLIGFALMKEKITHLLKYLMVSFAVGVLSFAPVLIAFGLPAQASMTTWGYLFGMPFYSVTVDLLAQIVFFFAIMLPATRFKPAFDKFSKKIAAVLLVLVIAQLFLSYRVNVATIIIFSFLGVYLFPAELLEKKNVQKFFFAIFLITSLFLGFILLNFYVPSSGIESAKYLKEETPSDSRFLAEPALGHFVVYFSEKKIMADLAVEYANEEYIKESFRFLETGDAKILEKNKIDYVFNRGHFIETQPVGIMYFKEPIEFYNLDKIYDNGVFYIHKVP